MKYYCYFYFLGIYVVVLDKVVYLYNRCFLFVLYLLRKVKKNFLFGKVEYRSVFEKFIQEEVMVNSLVYENVKNVIQVVGFVTVIGSKGCYCLMIFLDYDYIQQVFLDMMYLMKNVICEIVQLFIGYKDSVKVRKVE